MFAVRFDQFPSLRTASPYLDEEIAVSIAMESKAWARRIALAHDSVCHHHDRRLSSGLRDHLDRLRSRKLCDTVFPRRHGFVTHRERERNLHSDGVLLGAAMSGCDQRESQRCCDGKHLLFHVSLLFAQLWSFVLLSKAVSWAHFRAPPEKLQCTASKLSVTWR